jgi:hypothetical protein
MASFAKIGLNGKVIEVLSVINEVLHDSNGVEQEAIGIDFLTKLTGYPVWVQTSLIMAILEKILQELVILMMKIEMLLFHLNLLTLGY